MYQKISNFTICRYRTTSLVILIFLSFSSLSTLFIFTQENGVIDNNKASNFQDVPVLISEEPPSIISPKNPSFSIQPFQTPNILFIVADETLPHSNLDQPFYEFLTTNLSYTVTYHDYNNSYNYSNYDAIVISDSISGSVNITSLENVSIPILTMEKETWDVFNLGTGKGSSSQQNLWIDNTYHYITNQSTVGLLPVYNMTTELNYIKGYNALPSSSDIFPLGLLGGSKTPDIYYGTLVTLDKGGRDYTGINTTAERIAFLGTSQGEYLNLDGWKLWNNTIKWILYDDDSGNATINVNTVDVNGNPVSNANVTLVNSFNPTIFTTQYTDKNANTTFSNLSFGKYDILAKNDQIPTSLNSTFISQEIVGARTFHREALFNYIVTLNFSLDTAAPRVENITFQNISNTYTFFADVFDVDKLEDFFLNLTVYNTSNYLTPYILPKNYTMRPLSGNPGESGTYYNDTALDSLNHTAVEVFFNFIINDTFGYTTVTPVQSLFLEDLDAPIIHRYNVTDYGNGTLEFYANITDDSGIQDHVSLSINGTLAQMHLNESNLWIYRTQYFYGDFLNYTIYSVNDTVGNENGYKRYPIAIGEFSVSDFTPPQVFWITPYTAHDKGLVEWHVRINETTAFQSGLDFSSVKITISVNSGSNITQPMDELGANYFSYSNTFNFSDIIEFWINASDLIGNFRIEHAIFEINDISLPQVSFNAIEFGNGTVEFSATVEDWPNNITAVFAYENSTGIWKKYPLENITNNLYVGNFNNFSYVNRDIFYYVEAQDEAGNNNTLIQIKYLLLTDVISPIVNLNIENSPTIDGQITIRALAIDNWGSSQYITNPFFVNITHQGSTYTYPMEQEIIYFISTHSFTFGDQLTIKVWTTDDAGNQGIISTSITVSDHSPPKILDWGINEYQNGTISIWAEVIESSSGSGLFINNTSVKLEYIFTKVNEEIMATKETDNFYWYTITGFEPGNAFTYRITVIDNNGNVNSTGWNAVSILDKTPPSCHGCGYQEIHLNHSSSELIFWADATDTFGLIQGVQITLSYQSNSDMINETHLMPFNGSFYTYSAILRFNTSFSYLIQIYDSNETNTVFIYGEELKTYSGPVVYQADLVWLSENKILVWANVSEWGAPEVYFEYEFSSSSIGGTGSSKKEFLTHTVTMTFNGSLYTASVTLSEQGALQWRVIAYDIDNTMNWITSWQESSFEPDVSLTLNDMILPVILIAIVPTFLIITAFVVRRKYEQVMNERREIDRQYNEKLSFVNNIYAILVTTDVGIPIYNVSNVLYQADESLNLAFSGLSVGMADFLENFQSQILETYQSEDTKDVTELIRMSVIEQHKIQILIVASPSIRIFVFMKKKPTEFIREIFFKVANDLETQLKIPDLGIVDESLIEPQTEQILIKNIPLSLFRTITIDPIQLRHIDQQLKSGIRHFPISQAALNALKRLFIFQIKPEIMRGDAIAEIALFDKLSEEDTEYAFGELLYGDVLRILTKILKIPVSVTFEALWVGSSPLLSIIKPVNL
ncbi:MAG: carboxypeptidase-like regulatory domain-containing protein [Candidatus Hodarchaeota archaeon]